MTSVNISSGVAVSVDVNQFGKYVQFVKHSTVIRFHSEQWKLLCSSIDKITNALKNDKSIDIRLSIGTYVKTAELCGQNYVSFKQCSPEKYINLDSIEWDMFLENLHKIKDQYEMDIIYRGVRGEWQLVKAAVVGDKVYYKLASRLSDYTIVVLLKSYLIVKEIEKLNLGCKHVKNANWCEQCWKKTVESQFSLCNTVDLTSKLERLNNYMNWNVCIPSHSIPSVKEVYSLVYRNKDDRLRCACDCVRFDLPYIYRDLFKFLNL